MEIVGKCFGIIKRFLVIIIVGVMCYISDTLCNIITFLDNITKKYVLKPLITYI